MTRFLYLHIESQKYYTHVNKAVLPATIGDKMGRDTLLETGLFYVLLTSKGVNIAFPPPSPPCNYVVPKFKLPTETTNTPTLNGGDRGMVWILLFSDFTLFEYVSTILLPILDY